jgi:SAM-dependent methyltransferase
MIRTTWNSGYVGRPSISPAVASLLQAQAIGARATVLDLGSGSGLDSIYLAKWGCGVLAVEPVPALRGAARCRAVRQRVSNRITSIPAPFPTSTRAIRTRSVDAILDTLCWTNLNDSRAADLAYAKEAARLLRSTGLFVLHMRPKGHVTLIARPERWLPAPFIRYFRWSRLVLTHLAEHRSWTSREAIERGGLNLKYDHATVYVAFGRPRR